ncbi:MAG TPA: tetratricopeptide repeat protein, partial [Ktedonobacteraceae bacterium]|nr:tetratricopeptide repeat protein [Ktedonobacteraceae bacterium]
MHEKSNVERTIYRVQLWIEQGQYDLALTALQHLKTRNIDQTRLIAYISAWCHRLLEQWTEAQCLLNHLYPPSSIEENWNNSKHNERERQAFCLMCLGNAALELHRCEEASQHYTQCLKLLNERRVNLPLVRTKALHSLGMICITNGFCAMAIKHYEEALELCKQTPNYEDLPDIYYGLCEANHLFGKCESAYAFGVKALELSEQRAMRPLESRIQYLLGKICYEIDEHDEAANHYLKSLSIASTEHNQELKIANFTALSDLRLAEERLEEAKHYSRCGLQTADGLHNHYYLGLIYLTCGNVTLAESERTEGEQHDILFSKARRFFEQAEESLSQAQESALL